MKYEKSNDFKTNKKIDKSLDRFFKSMANNNRGISITTGNETVSFSANEIKEVTKKRS